MSIAIQGGGLLCNKTIRNLALSLVAKKHNLHAEYADYDLVNNKLGIKLFRGTKKYNRTINIKSNSYINTLNKNSINYNLNFSHDYFQSQEIIDVIYKHLRSDEQKSSIKKKNPFNDRYNNNNDLFIHIRLGDIVKNKFSLHSDYYLNGIKNISFDKLYIASDTLGHLLIKKIKMNYPDAVLVDKNPVQTIQFGSTCKNILLSHGSFSAIIGYLGFYSTIYFPNCECKWAPLSLFLNKGWNEVKY